MSKIQLGKAPKSFKHTIKAKLLDGTIGEMTVVYKYRTRKQFGEFIEGLLGDVGVKADSENDAPVNVTVADGANKGNEINADYLLQVLDNWDLDAPLNKENAVAFCDEFPGIANEVIKSYHLACTDGRLGN